MADGKTSTEPELDPSDPYAREGQTFPRLSEDMARRVARYGPEELLKAGDIVFARGQRGRDFFLVLDGSIEIFDTEDHGKSTVLTVHQARQFTGEMDLFNDRQILVSGRAGADSRVVRIKRANFRHLVTGEPDIGEILMRAFILRRVGVIRPGEGGGGFVWAGNGGGHPGLQAFLTLNGYLSR